MINPSAIRATLTEFLEEETDARNVSLEPSTSLREGLGLDSVDLVSVVVRIEGHYRIRLSYEELEQVVTVGDMTQLIVRKVAESTTTATAA